ncbi:SRPBCC family protein [Marivita sp. S2033]|uniref:SRPBCC family protein n=1 Tax=Marivita sp. S2033 TaxID=3373187 RepID=UPI003982606F
MQVTAIEDVAAPIDHVFAELIAFDVLERQALRRGIEVRRKFRGAMPETGEGWVAKFRFRGKEREADIQLAAFEPLNFLRFSGASGGLETDTQIELVPLSPGRTRVNVAFKMMPKSLSSRLLVQSLKLARSSINRKLKKRMTHYAREIELKATRSV